MRRSAAGRRNSDELIPWRTSQEAVSSVDFLLIEELAISLGLIQSLREQSINVTTYKPDTDKRARLIAQTDLFAGGSVRLPQRASGLEEFVAELLAFPGGHDDQVDALTQGLAWGRQSWSRRIRTYAVKGLY